MTSRSLVALAMTSAGLLLLALFDPWSSAPERPLGRVLAPTFDTAVRRLILLRPGGPRTEIQRSGGDAFKMRLPRPGPTDVGAARQLVSALGLLRASRQARARASHGLERPALRIEYELADGATGSLSIGARSADGRHQWLRLGQDGDSLLVEAHLIAEILQAHKELPGRQLFAPDWSLEEPVSVARGADWLRIEESRVSWSGSAGASLDMPLGRRQLRAWSESLRELRYASLLDSSQSCGSADSPLVFEQSGERTVIRECQGCEAGLVALSVDGRAGCIGQRDWQRLWGQVRDPRHLVDPHLFLARQPSEAFAIRCGSEQVSVQPSEVDAASLQAWWRGLDESVQALVDEEPMTELCSIEGPSYRASFGKLRGDWHAQVRGETMLRRLRPEVDALLHAESTLFESRELISEDPIFAKRIELTDGAARQLFERSEVLNVWHRQEPGLDDEAASLLASRLARALAHLRAERFANAGERAAVRRGSGRRIVIDFESPIRSEERRYEVLVVSSGRNCLVQVNQGDMAWVAPDSCQLLRGDGPEN